MILLLSVCALSVQVDERLVGRTWKTDNFWAETYDKPIVSARGEVEDTGDKINLFHWNSEGRIKFDAEDIDPPFWIGYRALTLSINSDAEILHHPFADVALAAAARLGRIGTHNTIYVSAGAGTANDGRWDNRSALFAVATIEVAHKSDDDTLWHVGLTLDGNRGMLASVPLPYFLYEARVGETLTVMAGFPRTEVVFRPFKPVMLSAQWAFPSNASGRFEVDLGGGFSVFADASRRIDAFHRRHEGRERLFYEMNTAELGFRWVTTGMDVGLSAGVAFGQRYFLGDDLRHRARGSGIEDLPYLALTFPSTFWAAPFSSGVER